MPSPTLRMAIVLKCRLQGKMLRKLYESFPGVHDVIVSNTLTRFRIDVDNLPSWEDNDSTGSYRASLCRDYGCSLHALMAGSYAAEEDLIGGESVVGNIHEIEDVIMAEANGSDHDRENPVASSSSSGCIRSSLSDSMPELVRGEAHMGITGLTPFLLQGRIGQDTLSAMIRQDETTTRSSRRRFYDVYTTQGDLLGKLRYPAGELSSSFLSLGLLTLTAGTPKTDPTPVGNWIKDQFGTRSAITAVFMIHGVLNESSQILNHYLDRSPEHGTKDTAEHVPVTLKHFKLLARLGKAPVRDRK